MNHIQLRDDSGEWPEKMSRNLFGRRGGEGIWGWGMAGAMKDWRMTGSLGVVLSEPGQADLAGLYPVCDGKPQKGFD